MSESNLHFESITPARLNRLLSAIPMLLQASEDAQGYGDGRWQFALTINELQTTGLWAADLRWLISLGLIDHAAESRLFSERRCFSPTAGLGITSRSCFQLTIDGVTLSRQLLRKFRKESTEDHKSRNAIRPRWYAQRRALILDGKLVKHFRTPADSQELILTAFEEEEWAEHIDDPLPRLSGVDATERLHNAIRRLNGNQKEGRIIFARDGTGEGIYWSA